MQFHPTRALPLVRRGACTAALALLLLICQPATEAAPRVTLWGPIAGAVTAHSARIWVRTNTLAAVRVQYSTASNLANARWTAVQSTRRSSDFTMRLPLEQLDAATTYYYRVLVNGKDPTPNRRPARFTTAAECGTPAEFTFGVLTDFGSSSVLRAERAVRSPVFRQLAMAKPVPQFVVIGGDFWHNEVEEHRLLSNDDYVDAERSRYRAMYSRESSQGPYNSFVNHILSRFALVHFWDDHDIGYNNAAKTYPHKGLALQVLNEYFPLYPTGPFGDWQSFCYGNADFFVLDARSQRDPHYLADGPDKSMLDGDNLGSAGQWAWLTDGLKNSTARWKIIFSPVTFNPTLLKHDAWRGYQNEHDRLVSFVRDNDISGVVIISGDTHGGGMDDGRNAGLPEMLVPGPNLYSSCFTSRSLGTWSHGVYGTVENIACRGYGLVRVMTDPDRLLFQVKDDKGNVKLEMELN